MSIKVTVVTPSKNRVVVNNQNKNVIRSVGLSGISGAGATNLVQLNDVDASDVDNNETLVYDENSGKFVVKTLPFINGGTF
jgi:hypothetical protein